MRDTEAPLSGRRREAAQNDVGILDAATLASMFVISPDMASVPVEINRLDNQMLVRYYEEEWKKWS